MGFSNHLSAKSTCSICGKKKIFSSLQDLYNGKICNTCINKLNADTDLKTVSISDARKRIELYDTLKENGKLSSMPPFPYASIEKYEADKRRANYIYSAKYENLSEAYYRDLPSIDSLWSVLYNLKDFNGENAKQYEKICLRNINNFKKIYEQFCIPYQTIEFDCVPAYKRLAMLYEKQKRYKEATLVCIDAIQHNVPNEYGDNNSKKMYSRLARMARKANLLEDENIKTILDTEENEKNVFNGNNVISNTTYNLETNDTKKQKRKKVSVPIGEHISTLSERIINTIVYIVLFIISFFIIAWLFSGWLTVGYILIFICFLLLIYLLFDTWKRKMTIDYKRIYEDELTEEDHQMIEKYKKK